MSNLNKWYWVLNDVSERNAGLSVRTRPIIKELKRYFLNFEIVSFTEIYDSFLERKTLKHAVGFIFSKPTSSINSFIMSELRLMGYPVLADIFDNYFVFSTLTFEGAIPWLGMRVLHSADSVIVSTPILQQYVENLAPTVSNFTVCDRLPDFSESAHLMEKWKVPSVVKKFLWFGISSNPYYQVGLSDLESCIPVMEYLAHSFSQKITVELVICSNDSPYLTAVIARFRQVGISVKFVKWTNESCQRELEQAHCVLLPTGNSDFIRSKTHNRLSEAIHNRCLVLTNQEGPYSEFLGNAIETKLLNLIRYLVDYNPIKIMELFENTISTLQKNIPFESQVKQLANQIISLNLKNDVVNASENVGYKAILMSSTGGLLAKLARKLNYLILGYKFNGINVNYDIFIDNVSLSPLGVLLICSDNGKNFLISRGFLIQEVGDKCLIELPIEFTQHIEKLCYLLSSNNSHEIIIKQISQLCMQLFSFLLGRDVIFFLGDDKGFCWNEFANNYNPSLKKTHYLLESIWQDSEPFFSE
jgi:hypothetical protein